MVNKFEAENANKMLLKEYIMSNIIILENFLEIAINLCDNIHRYHKKGIICKNLSSNNVIIDIEKKELRYLPSQECGKFNNLSYVSPEVTGSVNYEVSYASDLYSLGVIFYEMLTRELPFKSKDSLNIIYAHIAETPLPPEQLVKMPKVVSNIIMKLLSKNPTDRYGSIYGLKYDLLKCFKSYNENGYVRLFELGKQDEIDKFKIPNKLYGRKEEMNFLIDQFENCAQGQCSNTLIFGESGIGKSKLMESFQKYVLQNNGLFIKVQFDKDTHNIPYKSFIKGFHNAIQTMLAGDQGKIDDWKNKILNSLGDNGQVIINLLPELEPIIGKQPKLPCLSPLGEKKRFLSTMINFVSTFAEKSRVMVMFFDDLQWADNASINMLNSILNENEYKGYLIFAACKHKGYFYGELLSDEIINTSIHASFSKIELQPLNYEEIAQLIGDTLRCDKRRIKGLAKCILNKTKGNPLFTKELLTKLYEEGFIRFNYSIKVWEWDVNEINSFSIKEDVLSFIIDSLKHLPEKTKRVLKAASYIGSQFSASFLYAIMDLKNEDITKCLQESVNEGLISKLSRKDTYKFRHEKIHQAIYDLVQDEGESKIFHYKIGMYMMKNLNNYYCMTNHLNQCAYMLNEDEKLNLIMANYKCGKKSKSTAAFMEAKSYFIVAKELLKHDSWSENYKLTLDIHMELGECLYLTGEYEKSKIIFDDIIKNVNNDLDHANVINKQMNYYIQICNLKKVIELGKEALNLFNINIPDNLEEIAKENELYKSTILGKLDSMSTDEILNMPHMKNDKVNTIIKIYRSMCILYYAVEDNAMCFNMALRMLKTFIRYGHNNMAPDAYGMLGYTCIALFDDYERGYRYGRISLKISGRLNENHVDVRIMSLYANYINHRKNNIKKDIPYLRKVYDNSLKSLELLKSGYTVFQLVFRRLILGDKCESVMLELQKYLSALKIKDRNFYKLNHSIYDLLLCLKDGKDIENVLNRSIVLSEHTNIPSKIILSIHVNLKVVKVIGAFLYDKYDQGMQLKLNKEEERIIENSIVIIEYHFYYALTLLSIYDKVDEQKRNIYKIEIESIINRFEKLSEGCKQNFYCRYMLLMAEYNRIMNSNLEEVIECYDKSIEEAKISGYTNIMAIGNELAAKYCMGKRLKKFARTYAFYSCYNYNIWGAYGRVNYLKNKLLSLFNTKVNTMLDGIDENQYIEVDINSVIKASRAISDEIELENLFKKLISIMLKYSGAEKAVLVMNKNGGMVVEAEGYYNDTVVNVYNSVPLKEYNNISQSIVQYVSRTFNEVLLDNAAEDDEIFTADPYIFKNKIKSVLCMPVIYKGEVNFIMYFENNLTKGAFSNNKIETIKILAAQASISIENALLYKKSMKVNYELEKRVAKRTEELQKTVKKLQEEIGERQQIENIQRKNEERYKSLINFFPYALYVVSNNKNKFSNLAGAKLLGYNEPKELQNILLSKHINPKYLNLNNELRECKAITLDGMEVDVEIASTVIYFDNEMCMLIIARDIREKKKAEELGKSIEEKTKLLNEIMEYDKLKTEFFANISHELKTPVNVIYSALQMCQLLSDKCKSDCSEGQKKYFKMMKQNCYRQIRLINNIIDITKIDSGYLKLQFRNVDIINLIESITTSVVPYAESKGLEIIFDTQMEEKVICCDPDKIERIILNLLSNAIKFTDSGGSIYINIYNNKDTIAISVKDTGIGIPEQKKEAIFERFIQVDKSLSRNNEGSGIGLSLVKSLVEMHNGTITLLSEINKGSEFIIELPARKLEEDEIAADICSLNEQNKVETINIEFSDIYF